MPSTTSVRPSSRTSSTSAGAKVVWTDPYGGNASATAFPGALCQLVSATDNTATSSTRVQVFNRNKDNNATGVHAPN